jgi:hypothetical protein
MSSESLPPTTLGKLLLRWIPGHSSDQSARTDGPDKSRSENRGFEKSNARRGNQNSSAMVRKLSIARNGELS